MTFERVVCGGWVEGIFFSCRFVNRISTNFGTVECLKLSLFFLPFPSLMIIASSQGVLP